ncbi:NAD(P)/FAD-dependent oxidoreductase [Rhodococcus rhodnii]|uniref:Dehydrogenase n=2 Tax=Rhodococcus rhodnii TaxID=38312 RepID=R7WLU4_9NOCA|nr:NAD(P)/FAD-dependent oxidoreductase [Rhodococcus rhodnii]EOM76255.1 dehydrogenase [Rhodococcus rhodnii LMG 5362]TXG90734.1 NAD(P)/FAD-dependent oxidoreductase [Rhodococcus rhodnii]
MSTAVVVGSGPNGLAAAVHLARSGVAVTVLEAAETIGGGARSTEATLPGLVHDHCSAMHPLATASPFLRTLDLARHGLRWRTAEVDCAHPFDDAPPALLYRSIAATARGLGPDGSRWRRLVGPAAADLDRLAPEILRPVLHVPRHPVSLARFGIRALTPAAVTATVLRTERARGLFGGLAAHGFAPTTALASGAAGLAIAAAGHRHGWPVAEGGSGALVAALVAELRAAGGRIETGRRIRDRRELPPADVVLLDTAPTAAAEIYGDALPRRIARAMRAWRPGPAAFRVDYAVASGVPWTDRDLARAGTVHLGGTFAEIAGTLRSTARGVMPERPFVLVGQQYVADPTRSHGDAHPLYAYAHVPTGYDGDATEAVTAQIERFAPGFRERVLAVRTTAPAELERENPALVGGDIVGGATAGLRTLVRPRLALDPYSLGVPGAYLCSASTPPGAGTHGMCGFNAAESALRYLAR